MVWFCVKGAAELSLLSMATMAPPARLRARLSAMK